MPGEVFDSRLVIQAPAFERVTLFILRLKSAPRQRLGGRPLVDRARGFARWISGRAAKTTEYPAQRQHMARASARMPRIQPAPPRDRTNLSTLTQS
jgi:hypothetical protein